MVAKSVWIDCGRCWAWEKARLPVARQGWPPGVSINAATVQCITETMTPTARPTNSTVTKLTVESVDPFLQAFRDKVGI